MNALRSQCVVFAFLLIFCGCKDFQKKEIVNFERNVSEPKRTFTIPEKLITDFFRKYPTFQQIKKEDYSNLFWDFYDRNMIPNQSYTDINNDQILDYAMLLKEGSKLKLGIILSSGTEFSYWISPFSFENFKPDGVNFCVSVKPAGRTDVVKKMPESLVIKKNGFFLRNLEQDCFIFYEANGEINIFKML